MPLIENINYNMHNEIADLLKTNKDIIDDFINNPEQRDLTCLEIE